MQPARKTCKISQGIKEEVFFVFNSERWFELGVLGGFDCLCVCFVGFFKQISKIKTSANGKNPFLYSVRDLQHS